jgi:hypothetical protein
VKKGEILIMPDNLDFFDMPLGLPISEYPEMAFIEEGLFFNESDPPQDTIRKIEDSVQHFFSSFSFFEKPMRDEFSPIFLKIYRKFNEEKDFMKKKNIVYKEMVPFFKSWIIFTSANLFLMQKMNHACMTIGDKTSQIQ